MSWEEVRDLANLAKLNAKIAEDNLDDAINYLIECRRRLEESLEKSEPRDKKGKELGCVGYS